MKAVFCCVLFILEQTGNRKIAFSSMIVRLYNFVVFSCFWTDFSSYTFTNEKSDDGLDRLYAEILEIMEIFIFLLWACSLPECFILMSLYNFLTFACKHWNTADKIRPESVDNLLFITYFSFKRTFVIIGCRHLQSNVSELSHTRWRIWLFFNNYH